MKIIYGFGRSKLAKGSCLAVGVFDGVHVGHQRIINRTVSLAKKNKLLSVILTFWPHPDYILSARKYPPLLTSLDHRLNLIQSFGVDICIVVNFNSKFRQLSAKDFVEDVLLNKCRMKHFIMNRDFIFGRDQEGCEALVSKIAKQHSFRVHLVRSVNRKGTSVSSTVIRSYIMSGRLNLASKLLGRSVEVLGRVVGGDSRGKILGFPTANLDPHHEVVPPQGVYFVKAFLGKRCFSGLANIGFRPTFKEDKREVIELHILNFKRKIYGQDIRVVFLKRLRSEKRFKSPNILITQIKKDIQKAHQFFSL